MGGAIQTIEVSPNKGPEYIERSNRVSLSNQKGNGINGYLSQGASDAGSARMSNRLPFKYNGPNNSKQIRKISPGAPAEMYNQGLPTINGPGNIPPI